VVDLSLCLLKQPFAQPVRQQLPVAGFHDTDLVGVVGYVAQFDEHAAGEGFAQYEKITGFDRSVIAPALAKLGVFFPDYGLRREWRSSSGS